MGGTLLGRVGGAWNERRRNAEAEKLLRAAVAEEEKAGAADGWLAETLHRLAMSIHWQGRRDEVDALLGRSLAIARRADPKVTRATLAGILRDSAVVARVRGRYAEAQSFAEEALTLLEDVPGPAGRRAQADALVKLANIETDQHQLARADAHFRRAIALQEELGGKESPDLISALQGQGVRFVREDGGIAKVYPLRTRRRDRQEGPRLRRGGYGHAPRPARHGLRGPGAARAGRSYPDQIN